MNILDDGTVETYQELKSDRDRLHNIYIQQTIEINKLKGKLNNALREVVDLQRDEYGDVGRPSGAATKFD